MKALVLAAISIVTVLAQSAPVVVGRYADLFLHDNVLIAHSEGLRLVHAEARKHPRNPILVSDQPFEKGRVSYACVIHDVEEKTYKMWYEILDSNDYGRLHYAVSKDGIAWEKPRLNLIEWEGSKANNIVFLPVRPKKAKAYWVIKDYSDPDPARRYKMMHHRYDFRGRGVATAESPDGLNWTTRNYSSLVGEFDSHNLMFWDDRVGSFVAYLRFMIAGRRNFGRSTSPDAYHWSSPVPVHGPDAADPADREVYTPGVFKYGKARDVYVMLASMYDRGTNDVRGQLGVSRDGMSFHRFRNHFLPLGGPNEWDRGTVYPIGSEATVEGKTALYYTGNKLGHVLEVGNPGIGLALMHEGGFAGWRADGSGVLTTQLLTVRYVQDWMYLNAEASGGKVEAELLDPAGRVIPGFSRNECQPVRESGAMLLLRWKDMKALEPVLARGPFRLRLHVERATVYGIQCKLRPKAEMPL